MASYPNNPAPNVPLPEQPPSYWADDTIRQAYALCVAQERDPQSDLDVVLARILGYLLLYCPEAGLGSLAAEINSTGGDRAVFRELAKYWKDCFLGVWARPNVTPAITPRHPTRPSATLTMEEVSALLQSPPLTYDRSRAVALKRDRDCCIFSGVYNMEAPISSINPAIHHETGYLNLCHIWPRALTSKLSVPGKLEWTAAATTLLSRYMGDGATASVLNFFDRENAHNITNVFIAEQGLHGRFDRLKFCLSETIRPNVYKLTSIYPLSLPPHLIDKEIDLNSPYPDILKPPSRDFIRLHRAVAYVMHLSGAGALADEENRDREPDNFEELAVQGDEWNHGWNFLVDRLNAVAVTG